MKRKIAILKNSHKQILSQINGWMINKLGSYHFYYKLKKQSVSGNLITREAIEVDLDQSLYKLV
jgi:hypothetical protein